MLQHAGGRVPVTALAFAGSALLCGEGGTLEIYHSTRRTLLASSVVFEGTSIHGIVCHAQGQSYSVLVWGGVLVRVLELTFSDANGDNEVAITLTTKPVCCADWILQGEFCPNGASGASRIALITAHNALLLLEPNADQEPPNLRTATSQSRSILYSAALSWKTPDQILVASGTVFGQIIVWTAHLGDQPVSTRLHKVFTGHEGSPFGLHIAQTRLDTMYDGVSRFLVSCSDDRSVRLWDISDLSTISVDPHAAIDYASLVGGNGEHTGYSEASGSSDVVSSGCFARAMGHLSRIWAVNVICSNDAAGVFIVTFGEDATCNVWTCDPTDLAQDTNNIANLRLVKSLQCHAGKNIWAHAIHADNEKEVQIATGGADGSIAIHGLSLVSDLANHKDTQTKGIDLAAMDKRTSKSRVDKIRSYAFLTADFILVSTNDGHLYEVSLKQIPNLILEDLKTDPDVRWISQETDLSGFCMTGSIPTLSVAFLAGRSGSVYIYQSTSGLLKLLPGSRKATGIFARDCSNLANDYYQAMCLITWLNSRVAALMQLSIDSTASGSKDVSCRNTNLLELPSGEIVTAFTSGMHNVHTSLIIVGFRSGMIAFYSIDHSTIKENVDALVKPLWVQHLHADAITDLTVLGSQPARTFASTCRDGSFSIALLEFLDDAVSVNVVHALQIPAMTEAHRIYHQLGHTHIAGFRRKLFVLWNVETEQEVFSVDCGGSNRSWIHQVSTCAQVGFLAWTQASALHVKFTQANKVTRINEGSHGREIKAAAFIQKFGILATGAEDTDIKLSRVEQSTDGQLGMRCLRTLQKHNTGVQDLSWSSDGRRLISSGGMEELFVWRITEVSGFGVGVRCESTCPFTSAMPDLRITSISVMVKSADAITIAASRSDSTLHVYDYSVGSKGARWACVFTGTYLTCALTGILPIPHGQEMRYVALATDGHAAIFGAGSAADTRSSRARPTLDWKQRFKIHQSASHCAETALLDDGDYVLISGGDDNSLSISRVHFDSEKADEAHTGISTLTIPRAHSAAITTVRIVSKDTSQGKLQIMSGSLDQRVKMWEVSMDRNRSGVDGFEVTKLYNVHSSVADIAAVCSWSTGSEVWVVVCGVGWNGWRIGE